MKKVYLAFSLLILLFASCKKDGKSPSKPDSETDGKTFKVSFNVGIDAKSKTISTKSTGGQKTNAGVNIADAASFLAYFVYDSQNNLVSHFVQDIYSANFGSINDVLKPGTYNVILLATEGMPTLYNNKIFWRLASTIFTRNSRLR